MAYYTGSEIQGGTTAVARTGQVVVRPPVTVSQAGQVAYAWSTIAFASGVNPATNDVIEMVVLPAGFALVDYKLWTPDDWDTATGLLVRVGLMTGTPGDATRALAAVGSEFRAAAALGHTAPTTFETSTLITAMVAATSADRSIGVGVTAGPTGSPATTRTLHLVIGYTTLRAG